MPLFCDVWHLQTTPSQPWALIAVLVLQPFPSSLAETEQSHHHPKFRIEREKAYTANLAMEGAPAPPSAVGENQGRQSGDSIQASGPAGYSPPSDPSSANVGGDTVDEDEDVCRICRNPSEPGNPLRYPCACRGTIKYVHQECLLQWLNRRKISRCEVCKHAFSFAPIYAENAPARLSPQEFVLGIAVKIFRLLGLLQRFVYLCFVWLLVVPFITHWIWELSFIKSFGNAQSIFLSHLNASVIFADCVHGFVLSLGIAYIFLGVTFMKFILLQEPGAAQLLANRFFVPNRDMADDGRRWGITRVLHSIKRNIIFLLGWWEVLLARFSAYVGIAEVAPFNELVNMRAPFFVYDETAFMVIVSNLVFVVVIVLLPFSLGRSVITLRSWLSSSATTQILSSVIPMTESTLLLVNVLKNASGAISYFSSDSYGVGMPSPGVTEILNTEISKMEKARDSVSRSISATLYGEQKDETYRPTDDATLFIGYMVIVLFLVFYLGTLTMMRYARGEPLTMQRFFRTAFILDTTLPLVRKFFSLLWLVVTMVYSHFLTMVKVTFILGIKVGMFPLMCGWWLDVCTLRMFGQTIAERVKLIVENPVGMSLAYWIAGNCYLLYVFIYVSRIQEVLRDGVLFFLPDIADPNYNFFNRIIERPTYKHICFFLLSVGAHGSLIVMLVFLPTKLVIQFAPSVFPLTLFYSDTRTIAAVILRRCLFHFGFPCTVRFYYPSATFKALLRKWLIVVGSILGLNDFLLPRHEGNGGNVEPARRQRVHSVVGPVVAILEGSIVGTCTSDNADVTVEDREEEADSEFALRILMLLLLGWMTALIFNSLIMAVPLLLGRTLFQAVSHLLTSHGITYDDVYSFIIGTCIMRAVMIGAKHAVEHVQTRGVVVLLSQIWWWFITTFKSCALVLLWVVLIPILSGLLVDLMVVLPIRVPFDESSVFTLFQDWVLGIIFIVTLIGLIMVDSMHFSMDGSWLVKFERVLNHGLPQQPTLWLFLEILVPMMIRLLFALCVPYMFARLVLTMLGYPILIDSAIHRFVWPGCFAFSIVWFCAKIIRAWVTHLHNSIRDDRYRVGERLQNYGEDVNNKPNEVGNEVELQ